MAPYPALTESLLLLLSFVVLLLLHVAAVWGLRKLLPRLTPLSPRALWRLAGIAAGGFFLIFVVSQRQWQMEQTPLLEQVLVTFITQFFMVLIGEKVTRRVELEGSATTLVVSLVLWSLSFLGWAHLYTWLGL